MVGKMKTMKQFEVLQWASLFLEQNHCETKIAEILLQHHLQISRPHFFMNMREPVSENIVHNLKVDLEKHVETGVPVQHILGYETFYGRDFIVNEHVLIPRPETEELIEHVVAQSNGRSVKDVPLTIADIGTGSGVIATTLALEIPNATVYATDISDRALEIAQKNAKQLDVNVTFFQGDFLEPLIEKSIKVDMLISNPPYIAWSDEESLSRTVRNFDPEIALFAEDNGLAAYKRILEHAPAILKPNGSIVFEIGFEQGDAVSSLIKNAFPSSTIKVIPDINEKDRIVSVKMDNA